MDMKIEPKDPPRENEGKIVEKYVWKSLISKLEGWLPVTLRQINFFADNFKGF